MYDKEAFFFYIAKIKENEISFIEMKFVGRRVLAHVR